MSDERVSSLFDYKIQIHFIFIHIFFALFLVVASFSPEMTHAKHLSYSVDMQSVRDGMAFPATTKTLSEKTGTSILNYKYNNLRKMNVNMTQQ